MVTGGLTTVKTKKLKLHGEAMKEGETYIIVNYFSYRNDTATSGRKYTEWEGGLSVIADLGCIVPHKLKIPKGKPISRILILIGP
jgi:hypothetical protein